MKIRRLKIKDAKYMHEWMHNDRVTQYMNADFSKLSLEDTKDFIRDNRANANDIHMAIVSDDDEYMGTVSLKHIDKKTSSAEFDITVRFKAMNSGYSWYGMSEILRYAFDELQLSSVYWCVSVENTRAIRFYEKHGFNKIVDISDDILKRYSNASDLIWYAVYKGENIEADNKAVSEINGCRIVDIKTVSTANEGELSFFEGINDLGFEIKRIYYITKVCEGTRRGMHAHKNLKQIIFCPYGEVQFLLDDGEKQVEYTLNDSRKAIVIEKPVWREMVWIKTDSVLCVGASEYYDEDDYLRDYDGFMEYIKR